VRNKSRFFPIVAVIAIGVALGGLILTLDKTTTATSVDSVWPGRESGGTGDSSGDNGNSPYQTGPRGGKLFSAGGFGVEVTIFENGVPPRFRLYLYEHDKPLPPSAAKITITLVRLGAPAQVHHFKPEAGYLIGDQIVEEPHSFDVAIAAIRNGENFNWEYSQVEFRAEMSDETLNSIGVEILTAGPATVKPTLNLPGEVIFNEHTIVQVVPRLPGIVTAVHGHHGMQMRKGEVMAVIESQMLAELRSQYLIAQKRLALAQTTYEREKKLWEDKISAKQDYLAAQTQWSEAEIGLHLAAVKLRSLGVRPESKLSEENLARYEIRSPISGRITEKAVALGQTLKEDDHIYTVADVSTVWVALTVYPKDLGVIKVGQKAKIKATAFDLVGEGEVTYITTLIGEQTRTATARVELENKDARWRPGMFVNAELAAEEIQVPVAVAADALQTVSGWTVVFGRYGQYLEARPLELGIGDGKMIEVLSGFHAGEQYAGGNSFAIKAELGKSGASHDH
jgi:cobalt-zinc-cadmium efflux system membrane fusion protein